MQHMLFHCSANFVQIVLQHQLFLLYCSLYNIFQTAVTAINCSTNFCNAEPAYELQHRLCIAEPALILQQHTSIAAQTCVLRTAQAFTLRPCFSIEAPFSFQLKLFNWSTSFCIPAEEVCGFSSYSISLHLQILHRKTGFLQSVPFLTILSSLPDYIFKIFFY